MKVRFYVQWGFHSFTALIDMKPEPGGRYIHSASEPCNEEQEISQERINAWMDHFGMYKFQCHCSGHARSRDLLQIVDEINPRILSRVSCKLSAFLYFV
jgi:mRNA degradation ribonuclease J1/J2